MIAAVVLISACQKENVNGIPEGAMLLDTESVGGSHGTKTSVSELTVQWVDGDKVNINGNEYTVAITGSKAHTSTAVPASSSYRGYYPSSLTPSSILPENPSQQVTIPASYLSRIDGGRQVIPLPMVAYSDTPTNELLFRHLTAALHVQVTNSAGYPVYLDKVMVRSATQKLNGQVKINLAVSTLGLSSSYTTSTASEREVTVSFANEEVSIAADGSLNVQVPILPIANVANDLTIEVYAHSKANIAYGEGHHPALIDLTFSQTKAAPALDRNQMSRAAVELTDGTGNTNKVDHSLFSVASGTKVCFSQGNLQATTSNYGSSWSWAFAEDQWSR